MKQFPDESTMARSEDGTEPVRGGSIGLNRILNTLVAAANADKRPRFTGVLLNAYTIFRNVYTTESNPTITSVEKAFVQDLNLFLDYYDTYLSHVWNHQLTQALYAPVLVYFPDYQHIPKDVQREHSGKRADMEKLYDTFLRRHQTEHGLVRTLDHTRCFFVSVGQVHYPHKELIHTFREVASRKDSLYHTGEPIAIVTHIPLDLYLSYRLRNLSLLESNTGRIRPASEFATKLDKEGRVPFQSAVHAVVGDDKLIKPLVSHKVRREVLAVAAEERWNTRSESEVTSRLSRLTGISPTDLRHYNFA